MGDFPVQRGHSIRHGLKRLLCARQSLLPVKASAGTGRRSVDRGASRSGGRRSNARHKAYRHDWAEAAAVPCFAIMHFILVAVVLRRHLRPIVPVRLVPSIQAPPPAPARSSVYGPAPRTSRSLDRQERLARAEQALQAMTDAVASLHREVAHLQHFLSELQQSD